MLTDDVTPFEQRKLWLLNGGHSLLAYVGALRGAATVAEAVADAQVLRWLGQWWDEAGPGLALPGSTIEDYRAALLRRFTNARIQHRLDQVAVDGSLKLPVRVLPTLRAERAAGRSAEAGARILAGWLCYLRGDAGPVKDARAESVVELAAGPLRDAAARVVTFLDEPLGADAALVGLVSELAVSLTKG